MPRQTKTAATSGKAALPQLSKQMLVTFITCSLINADEADLWRCLEKFLQLRNRAQL